MGDELNRIVELEAQVRSLRARRGANAGEIHRRTVSAAAPSDKDLFIWDAKAKKWKPSGSAQVLFARATADLTLTTSAQSITGDGDSSKVRLALPTIGDWLVIGTCDFQVSATDPDRCLGELYVDDSGSAETGQVVFGEGQVNRATVRIFAILMSPPSPEP